MNSYTPDGFEYVFNPVTQKKELHLSLGYSEKHLKDNVKKYVPIKEIEIKENNSKAKKSNLDLAKKLKNDEFYTRKQDIDKEIKEYKNFFKDKIIYCPCDKVFNIGRSDFFNYFALNFKELGIKKLICTCYNPNGHGFTKEIDKQNYENCGLKWTWISDEQIYQEPDESEVCVEFLKENGSFASKECNEIMKGESGDGSDVVVVTNPPFSLFREFVNQVMECGCFFLCIGPINAISYKEIYPLIKEDKIWLGYTTPQIFEIPQTDVTDETKQFKENGKVYQKFGNICWFTNIYTEKRDKELLLTETYDENKYHKYSNYNAIEVPKVKLIPKDYFEPMGVPLSFLDKYCPKQFEIIKFRKGDDGKDVEVDGKCPYFRIIIKRRE